MKKISLFCISLKPNTVNINRFSFLNFHTSYWQMFSASMIFSFSLPGVKREYVGPVLADRLTPCSTLSRCSMSQTLPWLQCFYAKVSLSFGFQAACHQQPMSGRCSHFSFIFYDSLFDPLLFFLTCCHCGQMYLRTAHDPASYKIECAEMFCVL